MLLAVLLWLVMVLMVVLMVVVLLMMVMLLMVTLVVSGVGEEWLLVKISRGEFSGMLVLAGMIELTHKSRVAKWIMQFIIPQEFIMHSIPSRS